MYSSGPSNSVVLNKRILLPFYKWKGMILGKIQILLGEKCMLARFFVE